MKGYNKPELASLAAERLRERGYAVRIECRNGWFVVIARVPVANDNTGEATATVTER